MAKFDCLEKPLSMFFYKYGSIVAKHPLPFLLFPVLLSAGLSMGFLHKNEITDAIYLFTPVDAPSKAERRLIHQKWPVHHHNYIPGRAVTQTRECQVIAMSRDSGNILSPDYAKSVNRLNDFIVKEVNITYEGHTYFYTDLCLKWNANCHRNAHIALVANLYKIGHNVSFPSFRLGDFKIYLASSLGGVRLRQGANGSRVVGDAQAWLLIFQLKFQQDNESYISGLWERELEHRLLNQNFPGLEVTFFHSQTLTEELKRNAAALLPKFVFSFAVLVAFAVACSVTLVAGRPCVDWVLSKPLLALWGVCSAGMGVAAAIGLLNFCGQEYNSIVLIMPFLAVSIGVDNMFLLVAALARTSRGDAVPRRVALALSDAAVSITITALTDALSFGIGALTSIPAVRIFCLYTCAAIALTFLFQLTFFLALVVFYAKLEAARRHSVFFVKAIPAKEADDLDCVSQAFMLGSYPSMEVKKHNDGESFHDGSFMGRLFGDWYARILMHPVMKSLVIVWMCIYLGFGIWGCTQIREGLEPINLLVSNSYAIPHYRALEKYFWHYGTQVQIVINNAPDLGDPAERRKLESMMKAFANSPHAIGEEGVEYWMDDFDYYLRTGFRVQASSLELKESFYKFVCHFLATNPYDRWREDIYWSNRTGCMNVSTARIESFRFLVGMREIAKTTSQLEATNLMREIASRYPDYNVTTFMPLWLFTDQYQLIMPNTVQNIGIALACMLVIALLLIPQPLCALWVAFAIASIDVGVVGYMTLWGVNLDAISMITIIMSIGFSVDFSAHITYGYVVSESSKPTNRVRSALGALAWPILQGAMSTIFGVAVLATANAYMIVTFFKTVFLVIVIGVIHGLVFLPVLLSVFVRSACVGGTAKKQPEFHQAKNGKLGTPDNPPSLIPVRFYVVRPQGYVV